MSDSQRAQARPSNFLFLPLVMVLALTGCVSSKAGSMAYDNARKTAQTDVQGEEVPQKPSPNNILKTAFSQVGNPYRYGGASPETGFDCSGFVKWVYGQYDIKLPRSSGDMMTAGKVVDRRELKPGDLVFFGRKKRITHVGIYTGDDKYIHSPRTGKSIEESRLEARARGEYYVGARRILPNVNVEAIDEELKRMWIARESQSGDSTVPAEDDQSVQMAANETVAEARLLAAEGGLEALDGVELAEEMMNDAKAEGGSPSSESAVLIADNAGVKSEARPAENVAPPVEKVVTAKSSPAKKHKIVAGDTLYGLARKYDVSADALAKANNFNDKSKPVLKLGQMLVIPAKAGSVKTAQANVQAKPASVTSTVEKADSAPQTVAKATPTDTAGSEKKLSQHKVVSGDTLYSLARKYNVSIEALAKANNFADRDKAVLKLGQMLIVPAKADSLKVAQSASADVAAPESAPSQPEQVVAAKPKPTSEATAGKKSRQHKVASGDTLYDLARKYGISTDALAKANNLDTSKKNMLKLGQVLIVPSKTKTN